MIWRFWRRQQRSRKETDEEMKKAAAAPDAKRDRQPRNQEQAERDPETESAKPTDN